MSEFYLRHAEIGDMELLFEWANDPSVRANSFCSDPIDKEIHKRWFDNCLHDKNISIYILYYSANPIGQIRLNQKNGRVEISYSISRLYRGQGYGQKIIYLAERELTAEFPSIRIITACVKVDNIASQKVFEHCGYVCNLDGLGFQYTKELKQ